MFLVRSSVLDLFLPIGFIVEDHVSRRAPDVRANSGKGHVRGYQLDEQSVAGSSIEDR